MRVLRSVFLLAFLQFFTFTTLADTLPPPHISAHEENRNDIRQLKEATNALTDDIDVLRRDQINYRVEKDLLKEAYATSLQTINALITIALGVIGILGYLGIRNIKEIKTDYSTELENLKQLKLTLETELATLSEKQKLVSGRLDDLSKTNEEQDRRLKVLELVEKVASMIKEKQWTRALRWIEIALDIDPNNILLLSQKSTCHGRIGEFAQAIDCSKAILKIEPQHTGTLINLLEFLLLTNQTDEFEATYTTNKAIIEENRDGKIDEYLTILASLVKNETDSAIQKLEQIADKCPDEPREYLESFSFQEAIHYTNRIPPGKQRSVMAAMIRFFQGKTSPTDLKAVLSKYKTSSPDDAAPG